MMLARLPINGTHFGNNRHNPINNQIDFLEYGLKDIQELDVNHSSQIEHQLPKESKYGAIPGSNTYFSI